MDVKTLAIDKYKAAELYRKYQTHKHYETDIDREIKRAYREIAKGGVVIQAIDAIKRAGLNEQGLPKLALARATATHCFIERKRDGGMTMRDTNPNRSLRRGSRAGKEIRKYSAASFDFPPTSFPIYDPQHGHRVNQTNHKAIIPMIPIHLRPKRGIENYHILWEADWEAIPVDPYLLRRLGMGDLWLICAAWDLTEVERAAMSSRVAVN